MNKKTHARSKRKPRKRTTASSNVRGPFFASHPMFGLDKDVRRHLAAEIFSDAAARLDARLAQLVGLSSQLSPLDVLSFLSGYSLMAPLEEAAKAGNHTSGNYRIQQGHVEYMQALLLRHDYSRDGPLHTEKIQLVFDILPELFEAFSVVQLQASSLGSLTEQNGRQGAALGAVQAFLRSHTAVVRNWGHFSAVKRIANKVLGAADKEFRDAYGLTLTQLVSLFEYLVRWVENSVNDYRKRLHAIYHAGGPLAMAEELSKQFGDFPDYVELQKILTSTNMRAEDARQYAFVALQEVMPLWFLIDAETIACELGLSSDVVSRILKRISLPFGGLREKEPLDLFLDNPVWVRPIIEMDKDVYFCSLPQTLMSFIFPIVEDLAQSFPVLQKKLQRVRAQYLEDATEELMHLAFPGCQVKRGYKWTEGDRQYESDLAVRYDATILLVESKSGGVSWPALRGSPVRIARHIQELIVNPSDQSARLALQLQKAIAKLPNAIADFPLPLDGVLAISRLSVTLHDFGTMQCLPTLLRDAGLIKSEHRLAPCITLADLEVVVDILDAAYLRMHYLRRRAELFVVTPIFGDELDSLGMYLDSGFNLGEAEVGEIQLLALGYSERIDKYYSYLNEGVSTKKPRVNITPWIRAQCEQLLERGTLGWYEMVHALLGISYSEQQRLEREICGGLMKTDTSIGGPSTCRGRKRW